MLKLSRCRSPFISRRFSADRSTANRTRKRNAVYPIWRAVHAIDGLQGLSCCSSCIRGGGFDRRGLARGATRKTREIFVFQGFFASSDFAIRMDPVPWRNESEYLFHVLSDGSAEGESGAPVLPLPVSLHGAVRKACPAALGRSGKARASGVSIPSPRSVRWGVLGSATGQAGQSDEDLRRDVMRCDMSLPGRRWVGNGHHAGITKSGWTVGQADSIFCLLLDFEGRTV